MTLFPLDPGRCENTALFALFLVLGTAPILKGQSAQLVLGHWRTSLRLSPMQSRQYFRMSLVLHRLRRSPTAGGFFPILKGYRVQR